MKKLITIAIFLGVYVLNLRAQEHTVYNIDLKYDVPITLIGGGVTYFSFEKIFAKEQSDSSDIAAVNKNELIRLNRKAIVPFSQKWGDRSDYFFNASFPFPLFLLFDKNIRHDAASVGLLYLEALMITGSAYSLTASNVDKYRPYVFSDETSFDRKVKGGAKNSLFAGHPAVTATATFFAAKVYSDYHPGSWFSYVMYGIATLATAGNAYCRLKGGYHFPTDIMIGAVSGAAVGILVPALHKRKDQQLDQQGFHFRPIGGSYYGGALSYRF